MGHWIVQKPRVEPKRTEMWKNDINCTVFSIKLFHVHLDVEIISGVLSIAIQHENGVNCSIAANNNL